MIDFYHLVLVLPKQLKSDRFLELAQRYQLNWQGIQG